MGYRELTMEQYIENPCGLLSIPFWKAKRFSIPTNLIICHEKSLVKGSVISRDGEKYFRLIHRMKMIKEIELQEYQVITAKEKDISGIVEIINNSYDDMKMNCEEMKAYMEYPVYCPDLWIIVMHRESGKYVGCGIADYDGEARELILEWIQVLPEFRGRKIGTLIVNELLCRKKSEARFATVSGKVDNPTNPERLYRSCGFEGKDIWYVYNQNNLASEKD